MREVKYPPILAMWSGPRNLSTAMMRAWENRADTQVWDEPFYAAYLHRTGSDHPMREAIITQHESDPMRVITRCRQAPENGFFYQKHMTHHILPNDPLDWLAELQHCFLLRDPREVLLSYARKWDQVTLDETGLPQQLRLYRWVCEHLERPPLVIDAKDFLQQPAAYLQTVCDYVGIPFSETMLQWPAGKRDSDGVWAEHWYDAVWKSTGFSHWRPRQGELNDQLQAVYEQADVIYQQLWTQRLVL